VRQLFEAGPGVSIATLEWEYPAGWQVPSHAHRSDQLIYAVVGVMEVTAANTRWRVPPQFGIWIPANTEHSLHMRRPVSMRTLYLKPALVALPRCEIMQVSPLLRELVLETVRRGSLKTGRHADHPLRALLVSQIRKARTLPLRVPLPVDERARRLAEMVLVDTHRIGKLAAQCASAGISVRTLERIFRREVGTDFETWRRQVRLSKAQELLVSGRSVKDVAQAVGYGHASTFVSMFRRGLGVTPTAWLERYRL
jgi:AraC-like DNA-binding protein